MLFVLYEIGFLFFILILLVVSYLLHRLKRKMRQRYLKKYNYHLFLLFYCGVKAPFQALDTLDNLTIYMAWWLVYSL